MTPTRPFNELPRHYQRWMEQAPHHDLIFFAMSFTGFQIPPAYVP